MDIEEIGRNKDILTIGSLKEKIKDLKDDIPVIVLNDSYECNYDYATNDFCKTRVFKEVKLETDGEPYIGVELGIEELTDELLAEGWTEDRVYENKCFTIG